MWSPEDSIFLKLYGWHLNSHALLSSFICIFKVSIYLQRSEGIQERDREKQWGEGEEKGREGGKVGRKQRDKKERWEKGKKKKTECWKISAEPGDSKFGPQPWSAASQWIDSDISSYLFNDWIIGYWKSMIPGMMQGAKDNKVNKTGSSGHLTGYNLIGVKNTR